jgi:uncharacterized phiE125 gp8 family phage protein
MPDSPLLDAAKRQLGITDAIDDALLNDLIEAAVDHIERETGVLLAPRQITETVGAGRGWRLRGWPITSIETVTYRDLNAVEQTLPSSDLILDTTRRPAELSIAAAAPYRTVLGSMTVTMTAGYASLEDVPASLRQALMVLVAEFHANREAGALSADAQRSLHWLLRGHKVRLP